jgi:thymidylate kinase
VTALEAREIAPEPGLAGRLTAAAAEAGLTLAHWKSNNRLHLSVTGRDDLDMSIPPEQERALTQLMREFGFVAFDSRPWQRFAGGSDWLGLEEESGTLLHVHLHTRLLTGADGVMEQELPWLEMMNASLRRDPATGLAIPPPAFDAHLLVARETVKSRNFRSHILRLLRREPSSADAEEELAWLLARCGEEDLDHWGAAMWGRQRWRRMQPAFREGCVSDPAAFALLSSEIWDALRPHRIGTAPGVALRFIALRGVRAVHGVRARFTGTTLSGKRLIGRRAPVIAIVGSDGAGKSTVAADLERWLSREIDVATVYFGTNHGWFRRSRAMTIRLLPTRRRKARRAAQPMAEPASSTFPLWLQAFKWCVMARVRLYHQRRAQRLALGGTTVLADRYPQNEVHGTYDGPSRLDQPGIGLLARALQRDEHRSFSRLAETRPDLVIKLIVPVEVAQARKVDHDPLSLAEKVRLTRIIGFNGALVVEIDATQPLEAVLRDVRRHAWSSVRAAAERPDAIH